MPVKKISAVGKWRKYALAFFASLYWGAVLGTYWHNTIYAKAYVKRHSPIAWFGYALLVISVGLIVFYSVFDWLIYNTAPSDLWPFVIATFVFQAAFAYGVATDQDLDFARTVGFFGPLISVGRYALLTLLAAKTQLALGSITVIEAGKATEVPIYMALPPFFLLVEYLLAGISITALKFKTPSQF